jgi:glutamyl-tRNA synthetase
MFTALFAAGFGAANPVPRFAHEALLVGSEGKLSKRLGSLGCDAFRDRGIEPRAVIALLARLGTSKPVEPIADIAKLIDTFDLGSFGRAPARFDEAELERLNHAIVHQLPYVEVAGRLPEGIDEAAWLAIRPNLERIADAADWWRVVTGPIDLPPFDEETRAYLARAESALLWGDDTWATWTAALKADTGRKGKALFLPLRQALTGQDSGPEMARLLPLLGEETVRRRLRRAAA